MTTMQERYYHESDGEGGLRLSDRLRGVERTTDDGYTINAFKRGGDRVFLKLESAPWGSAQDVLDVDDRVSLAKLLLSDLPLDKVREALPPGLFETEWAFELIGTDQVWNSASDGGVFATREAAVADVTNCSPVAEEMGESRIVRREVSTWTEG